MKVYIVIVGQEIKTVTTNEKKAEEVKEEWRRWANCTDSRVNVRIEEREVED